ncbi:MAG TPA: hypothetical protein PKG88_03915 [Bacteroidales bacterium]|jgi:hypothetical protein|nr:hypothetical protein [Bacteroidales bacterium]HPS70928.1 hypothetical protein [Bacteroidales bacterium]
MTKSEFIDRYIYSFEYDFANINRDKIVLENTLDLLFEVLTDGIQYDISEGVIQKSEHYQYIFERGSVARQQIVFRCAYILEKIYFSYPGIINHPNLGFVQLCLIVKNKSAMRHFSKIMAHALQKNNLILSDSERDRIIEVLAEWVADPSIRVAVKVWVFECFLELQKESEIAKEVLVALWDLFSKNPTPGMIVRLKQWHKFLYF